MQPSKQCLRHHVAVRMKDCIVLIASYTTEFPEELDMQEIWTCNLWTDQWKAHAIPHQEKMPETRGCCAVAVEADVYIFGGLNGPQMLWKLTWNTITDSFELTAVQIKKHTKVASPRAFPCGWEYRRKMWIFGGFGPSPTLQSQSYLNDYGDFVNSVVNLGYNNQLLSFDPFTQTWKNVVCFGDVPSPRADPSTAIINDKVWLYGGLMLSGRKDDLYELNMASLSWTQLQTNMPRPPAMKSFSLTPVTPNHLVLHGSTDELKSTWILNVNSYKWKQHPVSHGRLLEYHTGITGLHSNAVILGGNAVEPDERTYRSLPSVQLEPKSLQQLAVRMIYENRAALPLNTLPSKLIRKMIGTRV